MASSTIARVQAFSSWLQAGGTASSESESNAWREECMALVSLLYAEDRLVQKLRTSIHQVTTCGRLRAMLSLLSACIHSPDILSPVCYHTVSNIHFKAATWTRCYLTIDPGIGRPNSAQLAVAEALLRAKVLQGCSRLLASAAAAVAASGQGPQPVQSRRSDEEARELDGALSTTNCLLPPLTTLCGGLQPDSPSRATGQGPTSRVMAQRASSSTTHGLDGSEGHAGAVKPGGEMQRGEKGQEGGLQGPEAAPGAVEQVATQPAGLLQQLVAALYDSCVLEHVARGVLVQAGYLQRMQRAGRQQGPEHGFLHFGLSNLCCFFAAQYADLLDLHFGRQIPGAHSIGSAASPQRGDDCVPEQAHRGEAAPALPHQQHASTPTPPLAASGQHVGAAHMPLLDRVLSGPCARHLVLCQGLRALCALDGGGDYGLPEEAGLQGLPLWVVRDDGEETQHVRLAATPLRNLVVMLAMHRGDQGPEAEAQLPSRGTRLQLTLRVAHAAASRAKAEAGGSGSGESSQRCVLSQADAASIGVCALRMAWRHMPPPAGPARADRRRAALRRWAAAAEQVACRVAATGARLRPVVVRNMACMLRLHPSYVGPLERQDLPSLAAGGHLLRALEALVSQAARAVGDQAGAPCNCTPAADARLWAPIGCALRSFVAELSCGVWPCPLRDLLLQPGEDEQPGAGQGQGGGGTGRVGCSGGGGLRATASLAVALGKLLRRCEGAVVESLAKCGGNAADKDFDQTGRDTAVEIMLAVCGVLLVSPHCAATAQLGARTGAGEGGAAPGPEGGEQLGCGWGARRRVWVCSYATWRWLPPLASMARRAAAAGHVNVASMLAWRACLMWVGRLCLACCRKSATGEVELEASEGHGGDEDSGAVAAKDGGEQPSPGDAGRCSCDVSGEPGGCWREFLLQDLGMVGLLGAALSGVVPELLAGDGEEGSRGLLKAVAEACVLAAMAFPAEVAQHAWGPQGGVTGGSGDGSSGTSSSGSSSVAVWSPKVLAELAGVVGGEQGRQPLAGALRALEQWGGECGRADGGPVGPSAEQRQLLEQAVAGMLPHVEPAGWSQQDVALLPPLCELRALLRVCSNPRCVALPPPGQTHAEAEAEAGGGRGACNGASSAAWYCCATCRKQHGRAGRGQGSRGEAVPA